jgi:hypothetical protein
MANQLSTSPSPDAEFSLLFWLLRDVHNLLICVHEGRSLVWEVHFVATARIRSHKHYRLDAAKIRQAQRVLRAETETETIERALDLAISEYERNRLAGLANSRFLSSGIRIKDVYRTLED